MTSDTDPSVGTVTILLRRYVAGDVTALNELMPLVYDELRRLADRQRRRWRGDETLNTTALVHEAYLRLVGQEDPQWTSRAHFKAVAARAMRQILIDHARRRRAAKRGGDRRRISLSDVRTALSASSEFTPAKAEALIALERSLERLEEHSERGSRVVECRFFAGMTVRETAEALGIAPATVKRAWAMARVWLYRDIRRGMPDESVGSASG